LLNKKGEFEFLNILIWNNNFLDEVHESIITSINNTLFFTQFLTIHNSFFVLYRHFSTNWIL